MSDDEYRDHITLGNDGDIFGFNSRLSDFNEKSDALNQQYESSKIDVAIRRRENELAMLKFAELDIGDTRNLSGISTQSKELLRGTLKASEFGPYADGYRFDESQLFAASQIESNESIAKVNTRQRRGGRGLGSRNVGSGEFTLGAVEGLTGTVLGAPFALVGLNLDAPIEVTNWLFGEPSSQAQADGRVIGGVLPLVGVLRGGKGYTVTDKAGSVSTRRGYLNEKYGRTGDLNADINIRGNKELATNFYLDQGWHPKRVESHVGGIDFSQSVDVFTLSKGQPLAQYQVGGNSVGNYFAPVGTRAEQLGVNPMGRETLIYAPTERVQVLRSSAAEIVDTWSVPGTPYRAEGGGTQFFTGNPDKFRIIYSNE